MNSLNNTKLVLLLISVSLTRAFTNVHQADHSQTSVKSVSSSERGERPRTTSSLDHVFVDEDAATDAADDYNPNDNSEHAYAGEGLNNEPSKAEMSRWIERMWRSIPLLDSSFVGDQVDASDDKKRAATKRASRDQTNYMNRRKSLLKLLNMKLVDNVKTHKKWSPPQQHQQQQQQYAPLQIDDLTGLMQHWPL